jgi:cobalt-zinc-cadmium efflux system outer membrane protein
VEFAFRRGASSVLEVLDARRTLRAVRLEALAARTEHAKAYAAWRAAQTTAEMLEAK